MALNGGPAFAFTPAVSLFVSCVDQAELDRLWDALSAADGAPQRCGRGDGPLRRLVADRAGSPGCDAE